MGEMGELVYEQVLQRESFYLVIEDKCILKMYAYIFTCNYRTLTTKQSFPKLSLWCGPPL